MMGMQLFFVISFILSNYNILIEHMNAVFILFSAFYVPSHFVTVLPFILKFTDGRLYLFQSHFCVFTGRYENS